MTSNLLNIGSSGTRAAQAALAVTGQNIANANNADYTRRRLDVAEVNATGGIGQFGDSRLSGVRVDGVGRTVSEFLAADARRTGSDIARADTQLSALRVAERAVEQSGIYPALVEFEAGLAALAADPLSTPLRAQVLQNARGAAETFNLAASGISSAMSESAFAAEDGVNRANNIAGELARTNTNLARAQDGSVSRAALLDQRDALLADMSELAGITATFDEVGRVTVRLGDAAGPVMVQGDAAGALSMGRAADGTVSFALDGTNIPLASGSLAGRAVALSRMADLRSEIDGIAGSLIATVNGTQANGVDPSGAVGALIFAGADAADINVVLTNPANIATAPAGSGPNSRDTGNLASLQSALANNGPTASIDAALFSLSAEINGRSITRDALQTIADSAAASLASETAVDLDEEAANLIRFQQAFQASGRVIQAATDIFDTILAIR